jgi:serine/threonine protein kinase
LLGLDNTAIVSDFGFARILNYENGNKTTKTIGPIRWMAPESLTEQIYSFKSDVWSFGVTAWELYARERPWNELDEINVILSVTSGKRLAISPNCPNTLKNIIYKYFKKKHKKFI